MFNNSNIIISGLNWIGDAVMSLPTIWAIRDALPEARITVMSPGWCADIYQICPAVDEVIRPVVDTRSPLGSLAQTVQEIKKRQFDSAILLPNSVRSAARLWLAGVPQRIGYDTDGRRLFLTDSLKLPTERPHTILYYRHLLEWLGIPWPAGEEKFSLSLTEITQRKTDKLLEDRSVDFSRQLIGFSPGAAWGPSKRWPADNFAAAINGLCCSTDRQALIFGSPGDMELNTDIHKKAKANIANLTGAFDNLRNLVDAISRCSVLVTNDSGPMHIAAAMGVPVVALFGPTDEKISGPWNANQSKSTILRAPDCQPCYNPQCKRDSSTCMGTISAENAIEAVEELLA
jgi:heptosyltransferase-2